MLFISNCVLFHLWHLTRANLRKQKEWTSLKSVKHVTWCNYMNMIEILKLIREINTWLVFFFLVYFPQGKNHSHAPGRTVTNASPAPTNSPATNAPTPARKSLPARCATVNSCAATTWPNTPDVTCRPRRCPTGKWRWPSWRTWRQRCKRTIKDWCR